MGGRVGGLTSKYYIETRGIKVSGGQFVKSGTMLTREGDKWQPGINVIGRSHLTASCDGEVYFTKKRNRYKRLITLINIRAVVKKTTAKTTTRKPVASKN
jgi:ribosomal protein L27